MDMWNWLSECYEDKLITLDDLREVLIDEEAAKALWEEFADDSADFVGFVRSEVRVFLRKAEE